MNLGGLAGLSGVYSGYQEAENQDLQNRLRKFLIDKGQYELSGQQGSDIALSRMGPGIAQAIGGLSGIPGLAGLGSSQNAPPQQGPQMPPQQQQPMGGQLASATPPPGGGAISPFGSRFSPMPGPSPGGQPASLPAAQGPLGADGSYAMMQRGPQPQAMMPGLQQRYPGAQLAGALPGGSPPQPQQMPYTPQQAPMGQPPQGPQQQPGPQAMTGGGVNWRSLFQELNDKNQDLPPAARAQAMERMMHLIAPIERAEATSAINSVRMMALLENLQTKMLMAGQGDTAGFLKRMGWTDKALDLARDIYLETSKLPSNLPRSQFGAIVTGEIERRAAEKAGEQGQSGADLAKNWQQYLGDTAYQRRAGTAAANIEINSNAVKQLIPQALEASRALPRGEWVPFNKIWQKIQQGQSDPLYNDFMAANFGLFTSYLKAMNPNGLPRITERLEAHFVGLLDTATDQKSYEVQVRRIWKEVQAEKAAVSETREGRTPGDINAPLPEPPGPVEGGTVRKGKTSTGIEYEIR